MRFSLSRVAALLGLALALVLSSAAHVSGFSIPVHLGMTEDELAALTAQVDGQDERFSEPAIEQIKEANERQDSIGRLSAALFRPERHFTNEEFFDSSERIRDLREEVIDLVTRDQPNGDAARERLGAALHTIQDFYSHSTWVERGNPGIVGGFGETIFRDPAASVDACQDDNANNLLPGGGDDDTTSAYYVGIFGCDDIPPGKCWHGNYSNSCPGINKDLDAAGAASKNVAQNPFHDMAAGRATDATRVFVQGILDDLAGDDDALAALLDLRGSVGFVIDDTGSMGPEIGGVANLVERIIALTSIDIFSLPENYVLVRFGDPNVGQPFVTEDPAALLAAVEAIRPRGGGDCPELAQTGLLRAIDAARTNSNLYFFSDATSKDAHLANQVIARAQDQGTTIAYVLTGSCSPIDPAYLRAAEETGGQAFVVSASEIPLLFDFLRPRLEGDLTLLSRHRGDLGAASTVVLDAPVDSTVTGLLLSVSVDSKDEIRLRRPDGTVVAEGDPGVTMAELSSGCIVTVDAPQAGAWQVEIDGAGAYSAALQGNSPLELSRFDFVVLDGDLHGGYLPIAGQPVLGTEGLGEAALLGPWATASFELVDGDGQSLGPVDLAQGYPDSDRSHFMGTLDLPSASFRVSVEGLDEAGYPYRRQYPAVYRAQSLAVAVDGAELVEVASGSTIQVDFTVTNLGTAGTFTASAVDSEGFVSGVTPTGLSLAAGATGTVRVTLDVPASAIEGLGSALTVTVTRAGDATVFNSARASILVGGNQPPDCSAAALADVVLWPPNGTLQEIDVAAEADVTDPDGDEVTVEILAITQDEPVDGLGDGDTAPDGLGLGESMARVRAERAGTGNGRVYAIDFRASDPSGASCQAQLRVSVPHDRSAPAVDDGQVFDSTGQ